MPYQKLFTAEIIRVVIRYPELMRYCFFTPHRNNLSGLVLLGSSRWIDDQEIQSKIFNGHLGDLLGLRIKTYPPIGEY